MLNDRFSAILGERQKKISTVAQETGISRTTLTNLYYKRSTSISFDVMDKLCDNLHCRVGDLFQQQEDFKGGKM